MLYQRSLYQSMQTLVGRAFQLLRQKARGEAVGDTDLAAAALEAEGAVRQIMRRITNRKIDAKKIRIHGDYHLGQVLYTGKDFVIMDFEGEPGRALAERKLRYPAYRDIAGMLRSIHYAGYATMFLNPTYREEDYPLLERWIAVWYRNIAGLFLGAYYETMGDSSIVPEDPAQRRLLLDASIVEKAAYELTYELNNRPGWAVIPLKGILSIVETEIGIER
jgi:maltose alpha-D-glucosyltransferase/alpha-amylase